MIIDQYYPDPEGRAWLYKRWRDSQGGLIEEHIGPDEFEPYFWVPTRHIGRVSDRIIARYPGSRVETKETAEPLPGLHAPTGLTKVVAHRPSEVIAMRDEFYQTYEADVRYPDRYLIDCVPEMPEWTPRVWHFDIEAVYVGSKEEMCTVICVWDSFTPHPVTFAWSREQEELKDRGHPSAETLTIDRVEGYELRLFGSEGAVLEGFMQYMEECDPDILVAHGANFFDIPHLVRRLDDFTRLSPIRKMRRPPKRKGYYDDTDQPILGRLVFDTSARGSTGGGFERVWMDSGKGQLPNRKLNTIAQELGIGEKHDVDASDWSIWEGGHPTISFWDYVDYCVQDTRLLRLIDERLHALDFFLSLQRLCGVCFESSHRVTHFARGLLSRRTHYKAPSRSKDERPKLEGAFIPPPAPGRYEDVACLDFKGLYPSIILSHNLSWETCMTVGQPTEGELESGAVHLLPNGTAWLQEPKGLLPSIVEEMFDLRTMLKQRMAEADTAEEREGWNTFQMAVKRTMASLYGMCAAPGYGWGSYDIASAITSVGRDSIRLLLKEAEEQGYRALYGHTDSSYIEVPLEEAQPLAERLSALAQEQLDAPQLIVELEAYYPYWTVAKKNRYFGIKSWPPEEAGELKVAGYEYKTSSASPVSKRVQGLLFNIISEGGEEDDVVSAVRPLAKMLLAGELSPNEVASWTRIGKDPKDYDKTVPNGAKGALYYNTHIGNGAKFQRGDSVPWVYVCGVPEGLPDTNVVAYMEESDLAGFTLDWATMVDKLMLAKMTVMGEAMGWDANRSVGKPGPKRYW